MRLRGQFKESVPEFIGQVCDRLFLSKDADYLMVTFTPSAMFISLDELHDHMFMTELKINPLFNSYRCESASKDENGNPTNKVCLVLHAKQFIDILKKSGGSDYTTVVNGQNINKKACSNIITAKNLSLTRSIQVSPSPGRLATF